MTQAVALNLKEVATQDPNSSPELPRTFHERTGHVLDAEHNVLQEQLVKLKKFAAENKMKLNDTRKQSDDIQSRHLE